MVEKYAEIGIFNPVEMHLLVHFKGMVARLCIATVGGKSLEVNRSNNGFPK